MTSSVCVSLRVRASPARAFSAFTDDIGLWWRPNGLLQITPRGDGVLSFVEEPTRRLVATLPNGKVFEIGQVTIWEPGSRLAFTWRQATFAPDQLTQVDVRFEPVGEETRITVNHLGWDSVPQEHVARHGFPLPIFLKHQGEQWRGGIKAMAAAWEAS